MTPFSGRRLDRRSLTCIEAHPARTFGEEATKRERMLYPSLVDGRSVRA
jgi:hypothetical protein